MMDEYILLPPAYCLLSGFCVGWRAQGCTARANAVWCSAGDVLIQISETLRRLTAEIEGVVSAPAPLPTMRVPLCSGTFRST